MKSSKAEIVNYTGVLDNLPVAVILFDNNRIYYLNKTGHKILGAKKPCDFLKKKISVFDFLLPEFHKKIKENNIKILNKKPHQRLGFSIKDLNGNILHLESSSNLIEFNGKKVIQTTIQDITVRKIQEQELSDVKEKFQIISNNAHDVIYFFTYDPKPKYLYISPSVESVLGYKASEFYKDPFFINKKTIGTNNDLKKHEKLAAIQQKNNTFKQKKVIYKMLGKDGKEVWMEDHVLPINDDKGKIKFAFGIVRNITDLKEKEEELKQRWSDYSELLNETPIAFFIHRNGHCVMCNKEAVMILKEKSANAIIGKYLVNFIVPKQRQKAIERMGEALKGKQLDFLPYQIKDTKGKIINVELKTVPIKYGGENCVLTIMQDVTNKEVYEKERLRAELAEEHNKILITEIETRNLVEAKLQTVFNTSTHIIWTVDTEFKLTSFNENYVNQIKKYYKDFSSAVKEGINFQELYKKALSKIEYDYWMDKYSDAFRGNNILFETEKTLDNGEKIYREVYLNPTKNSKGKVIEVVAISHNITRRKVNEQKALEQAAKLKAIFDSGTHILWTVDRKMNYTSFNRSFSDAICDLYGSCPEINKGVVRPKSKIAIEEYNKTWEGKYEDAFNGNTVEFVSERTNEKGVRVFRQIYLHPVYNEKEIVEVSGMGVDITDKVLNERKIVNQAAKLRAVFNGSSHYIWTVDEKSKLTSFNKNFKDLIERTYKTEPKEGRKINQEPFISDSEYNDWWNEQFEKAFKGESLNFETAFTDQDKKKIYLDVFLNPIYHDNKIIEVSGIAHDITERVYHEEKVNQSLKEKEVLLKEVHHRVKNNMQVISSILNLQSSYVTDQYALNLLKESQNRIKTMAYIHESLYQNKTFTSINFSEYVSTLASNILQSYSASVQKITLAIDVQKIILSLDMSIPAGLIINELVTNSIKHAFTESNEGIIVINLHTKDNVLFLEVSDNGKGFPKEIDFKNTNSLGLQLVNTLVEQLNGKLELKENKNKGTSFFINFPM